MSSFTNEQKERTGYPVTMSEFAVIDVREEKKSDCEDACMCCGACGLICLLLGLVGSYIAWLVFSIIGMTEVSDETLRENHCGSLLWRYVLTMAILTWVQIGSAKPSKNDADGDLCGKLCGILFSYLLAIGMASWGSYELWGRSCSDDLQQYTLYPCAYSMVVYQWIIVGLITIAGLCLAVTGCLSTESTKVPVNESNELSYNNESSDAIQRANIKIREDSFDKV